MKKLDLTNQRFGYLTVISEASSINGLIAWNCKCDCGNIKIFLSKVLRRKLATTHCGCKWYHDLIGQRFGRLLVRNKFPGKRRIWNCICDCGGEIDLPSASLVKGMTKSCGCLFWEHTTGKAKQKRESFSFSWIRSRIELLNYYKKAAKKRNLTFELTDEQCFSLFKGSCYYCGIEPFNRINVYTDKNGKLRKGYSILAHNFNLEEAVYVYNGIDRTDNSLGYTNKEGQCVSCCKICNIAKRDLTIEEWHKYLDRLVNYRLSTKTSVKIA